MITRHPLSYKWVLIGAGVIVGLNYLIRALLADPVRVQLIASFEGNTGVYLYAAIVAFVSFFVGGAVVGVWSPGETIKEPAFAALIAISLNAIDNFGSVDGSSSTVSDWSLGTTIVAVVSFAMTSAGAWVGERLQGGTEEKEKEEHGAPPSGSE